MSTDAPSGPSGGAIGILGGTFDPVHLGHLALAHEAMLALDLERVLFVPNADPPHKQDHDVTPAAQREAMVALAIADDPDFELSRIELERPGPSYAVDTVGVLAARSRAEGRPDPWFILSSEALEEFATWREPGRILDMCRLAVGPRPGSEPLGSEWVLAHHPGRDDRFAFLTGPQVDIASTSIRENVERGVSVAALVPAPVAEYIEREGLYRGADDSAEEDDDVEHEQGALDRALDGDALTPGGLEGGTDGVTADQGGAADEGEEPRAGLPTRRGPGMSVSRPRLSVEPGEVDAAALALAHRIVELAQEKKASDIVLLDVRGQTTITDYFVICSGASDRQLGAIAAGIVEGAKEAGHAPLNREGDAGSHWLLIDLGGVIVHVMSTPEREYYQLEKLWSDAALLLRIL